MTKRNMAAAKVARTRKSGVRTALMLSTGVLALIAAAPALAQVPDVNALPGNGQIVGGAGTINGPVANHLQIDQSSERLLINWDSFDIGQDASVDFDQQAGDQSIAVNRVIGSGMAPSLIFGEMTANGTVVIVNGNGVIFGGTANVDVGRLVATTSGVADADVMNGGDLHFSGPASSTSAISILSGANISVAEAGLAAFVGPQVSNAGTITARGGRVVLASGVDYTLDFARDGLLEIALGADSPLVTQAGHILAEGGLVQISAAAAAGMIGEVINVSGTLSVTSATLDDGAIVLSAGNGAGGGVIVSADLTVSGDIQIDARSINGAGDVDVTDGELALNLDVGGIDTTAETLIADALGVIGAVDGGTTLNLGAGTYAAGALINTANVTVDGGGVARISATQNGENGLSVGGNGDGAVITGLEIFGQATSAYNTFAWGGTITRGIVVANGADNVTVTGNDIHDVRNGILIDGRNVTGGAFTNNSIDNTKSAISVQYTDASNLDIFGNSQGAYGNEWGVNLHLNQVWNGVTLSPSAGALGANPSATVQQHILGMSQDNNGMSVYDQAYSASNRSHVNVATTGLGGAQGSLATPINTVQGGVNAVVAGGHVNILAGDYAGLVTINKSVTLHGAGMDETHLMGGINLVNGSPFTGLTLQGFTLSGDGGGNAVVRNGRVTNLTVDDVRFDGENAAGRHGFAGGQFGGAISITNSEFLNIRGFSAFDTSTGGTATAITSVVFSDNLLDGTAGHVTFRQATPTAHVLISGNTVGNVGDTTDLSSGIFKVFGASTVDFIDNAVTGVGASPSKFTAGVNDGAALLVRGVGTLNITDNVFTDNQQAFLVGAGNALPTVTNITGNTFNNNAYDIFLPASTGGAINFGAGNNFVSGADTMAHVTWVGSAALDMTGVMFDGELGSAMSDTELFALEDRIRHGVDTAGAGLVTVKDGHLFATATAGNLGRAVDLATDGDTVNVADGTHNIGSTRLIVDESITLTGQSEAGTIIDGRGVGGGLGTMLVSADDVSLSNFTLYGADSGVNNFGIKVQPDPLGYSTTQRLYNFSISDVTVQGSTRAELDLNGVIGATITNFTANGYRVGTTTVTGGAGVQITDSQDIYLSGVTTLGNDWGSVAIYQSNKAGAYDGLTNNINIDGANSNFSEFLGVFVESYSTLYPQIGQLNLTGFDYAVRNPAHRAGGQNFTFFRSDLADATSFALALANAGSSSIEGYTGTAYTNEFTVVNGLLINSALRDVRTGGVVNVGAGTFNETVAITRGLTLSGAGMDDTFITGGILLTGAINDLTLDGFTVRGAAASNTVIRGVGASITDFTMNDVRMDAQSVAGRQGISGGHYGGAISLTNSEFLNVDHWVVFDTRSGSGAPGAGTNVSSFLFSGNLVDNVQGGITVRQSDGGTGSVTISDNIVQNIGDSAQSSGGIFKIFNAGTVLFEGNTISDIGTNASMTSDGTAYGAALLVRGVNDLRVIDNSFTNVHMAVATEKASGVVSFAAPGSTLFEGNSFVNVAYGLFMPSDALGGGSLAFGAGNAFTGGADTLQHIVWRGAAGIDLTDVSFDGLTGSSMTLDQLFGLEDLITHGTDVAGAGLARVDSGHLFVTEGSGVDAALRALALADSGDTLNLSAGTHTLTNTLFIQGDGISVAGQGQGQTIIDASGHGAYGIRVHGDDVSLSGFTLNGSAAVTNASYGVNVEAASGSGASGRNTGFSIADVAISGSRKTGLDLNSVRDVVIDGVTVTGVIAGNGIAVTDSASVMIRNTTTSGNAWGGLALYQRNSFSDQQLTDITVDASNSFGETNGVYLQQYASALHEAENLIIEGFDFVVHNDQQDGGATSYLWFQKTQQGAIDFAVNVANTDASLVGGWTGGDFDGTFAVGVGNLAGGGTRAMSIAAAVNAADDGNIVRILDGTYVITSTLNVDQSVSLIGAGQGRTFIDGSALNSYGMLVGADDVSLSGFTFQGNNSTSSGHYGIKVQPDTGDASDRVRDFAISDVTIQGWGGSELDLNGVVGATITNVTVDGQGTKGVGIGVTDSADVTLSGVTTLNNLWGSVALYQANRFYDQQLTDIHIVAGDNSFGELLGVFAQSYSNIGLEIGDLYLTGFDFTVVNPDHRTDGDDFTFFRASLDDAIDFAVNLNPVEADASLVQGFDGSDGTGHYYVGVGDLLGGGTQNLSIQTAFNGSTTDNTVHVASGDYAESLTLNDRRTVLFGEVGVTGMTIAAGASESSLAGELTAGAGGLTFAARIYLADDLNLTTTGGGVIDLARIDGTTEGGQSLTVVGSAGVTLAAAGSSTDLASLDVEGASITSNGAFTTGGQRFDADDIRLAGAYQAGGDFTADGAVELTGDVSISGSGLDVALGTVDGAHKLIIDGGPVVLGAVGSTDALVGLDVTGTTIVTSGATTTGVQTYMGAVTLAGAYAASDFSANGAATLAGDTAIDAGGNVTLASIDGGHGLSIDAGGSASLGAVGGTAALDTLDVSGASIRTHGAVTTGDQAYSGAASFAGDYHLIGAGDFTASGAATLTGDTVIETGDGAILLGSVNGSSAGGQALTLDAGDNSVTVGDFGSPVRLGAVSVHAARTVLQGNVYAGDRLRFTGGDGATVRLTRASTTFNTSQSASAAGDITIQPHLIGTTSGGQGVFFSAGNGLSSSASGDITLGDAGTDTVRLGAMTATGDNFSAATVKLADDYISLLAGDQVFTDDTLDTHGDVMMSVGGNESGSIAAQGSVFINAGGSGSGALTAGGPVNLGYGTGTDRGITSGGDVNLSSTNGQVGGFIASGGGVNVTGGGNVSTTIVAQGDVGVTSGGSITSNITTPSEVTLNAGQLVQVTVNAGTVVVNAPGGTITGVFTGITTPGNATIVVNGEAIVGEGDATARQILINSFLTPAGGVVGPNGQIELPVGLAIALIAPAGEGEGQRRPIIVNDIARLGELLRLGYTAIVVQMDEGDEPPFEQELDLAQGEDTTPAG